MTKALKVQGALGDQGRHFDPAQSGGMVRILGREPVDLFFLCSFLVLGPMLGNAEDPVGDQIWPQPWKAQLPLILA